MIYYKILDKEDFLNKLFREAVWDNFYLVGGVFDSFIRQEITPVKECKWSRVRELLREWPGEAEEKTAFKMTLSPDWKASDNTAFAGVDRVLVHIRFAEGEIAVITGISYETFVLDKTAEK